MYSPKLRCALWVIFSFIPFEKILPFRNTIIYPSIILCEYFRNELLNSVCKCQIWQRRTKFYLTNPALNKLNRSSGVIFVRRDMFTSSIQSSQYSRFSENYCGMTYNHQYFKKKVQYFWPSPVTIFTITTTWSDQFGM